MILKIIAVRDQVADAYAAPQFVLSTGSAVRGFADEVNRKAENNALNAHPEDFALYELGSYDDQSAAFVLLPAPRQLALAKDLIRSSN